MARTTANQLRRTTPATNAGRQERDDREKQKKAAHWQDLAVAGGARPSGRPGLN
jgi:hypothetical protein